MARSKFPGKPSKPVNKRRINVLKAGNSETLASPTQDLQEDCQHTKVANNNSQTSGKCVRQKRKSCKVQLDRPVVTTKHPRIANSSRGRPSRQCNTKRSEKQLSSNCTNSRKPNIESNNLVGKFVLPSRSAHSSRVIKPNKRFLNVDAVTNVQLRTVIKRSTAYKRKCPENEITSTVTENSIQKSKVDNEELQTVDTGNMSRLQNSNRRIILRQARLQLDTQRVGLEGPFSSNFNCNNTSPPGTVTCGVCGAVRFYRFVNQARKFNIYSCESCRKFISKMIKRQRCNKGSILQCLKGQGVCLVPPVLRSQLWKSRCAYKARCNACWLKMCLRSFQIPQPLKTSLMETLPEFMQETTNTTVFNNSSLFSFHTTNVNISPETTKTSSIPQRVLRRKVGDKDYEKSNVVFPPTDIKRQKIDLKGPRVKHVCRSASIVLGQAVAVFSETSDKSPDVIMEPSNNVDESENKENDSLRDENTCSKIYAKSKGAMLESQQDIAVKPVLSKSEVSSSFVSKRDRDKCKLQNLQQINYFPEIKFPRKPLDIINRICFDFWENYDPEEICQSGFGLISSTSFPMFAICFLCGSAGQDPLLYCCSCCEPYHPFCLEQTPLSINPSNHFYDWLCPRCVRCFTCGEITKTRINCHKCHKPYHPECFNIEWQSGSTRPNVCSTCMRCKSCGTPNITKFIGKTSLCIKCFRLKNKGNFCPLCHECYEENDYDIKMMECGKCNMWVHAKCEGLSDEQYQILSTLPDSIEFLCCICEPFPYWRKAVDTELQSCFNKILKLLSKNKVARAALKWNPILFKPPLVKPTAARKIVFVDPENEGVSNLSLEDAPVDLNEVVFKSSITDISETESPVENTDNHILKTPTTPSLTSIKNKINRQDFLTLREFNFNMEEVIDSTGSAELSNIYHSILKEIVPWFDPSASISDVDVSFCDTSRVNNVPTEEVQDVGYKVINNIENDTRICVLCKGVGDGLCYKEGRLIYCGNNEWIHANCAIWSSEVYEEIDGSLQNVHAAITRGRSMSCTHCKIRGASIGCCSRTCNEIYHFPCAYTKQCHFMHDKSFYCHAHYRPGEISRLSSPSEFVLSRSIYVELDQRKKRYTEPKRVQFMVGSLTITCLGVILPQVSDNPEALIPINFTCQRLFWSTIEPWKLVPYIITTTLLNNDIPTKYVERNFTVDHSLASSMLSDKLKEVSSWQKDIDIEVEDDEEPQNENAPDLLSPELTDAILEELPLGVLDRISMQDIFPKLLGTEEILATDFKLTDILNTEAGSMNEIDKKVPSVDEEAVTDKKNCKFSSNKFPNLHNRQRCSITVSCKVDNTLTTSSKSRSKNKSLYFPLVQVDGAFDNSSSDCDSAIQDVEDLYTPQLSDEPVKCQRCQCTYRTEASYTRHLETCDSISTSDSDSDVVLESNMIDNSIYTPVPTSLENSNTEVLSVIQNNSEEPYVVSSYESYASFQTAQNELHSSAVNTQTFLSSESTAEVIPISQNEIYYSNLQPEIETKTETLYSQTNAFPVTLNQPLNCESPSQVTIGRTQTLTYNQQSTNQILNHNNSLYLSQPSCNQPGTISIVQPSPVSTLSLSAATPLHLAQPIEIQQAQHLTIQSVPMQQDVTPIINIAPQNQITLGATKLLPNHLVAVSQNQLGRPAIHTVVAQKTIRPRGRPRSLAVKRTTRPTVFFPQGSSGAPSVVIHQLPSTNMIPTFLESFQQQTGQNLQFVTSITPQIAPVVNQPHMMQFQPDGSVVNLLQTVQPTVILPQTQVLSDQIIVDNGNQLMWPQQSLQTIQPIMYGFETIVQNTVLQSQQFLPTTVPGILTANSSFSSTTQVFQTSKLEPVLDVSSGNFVIVNQTPVVNPQTISMPEHVITQVPPTTRIASVSKPTLKNTYVQASIDTFLPKEVVKTTTHASTTTTPHIKVSEISSKNLISNKTGSSTPIISTNTNTSINSSINLPLAPSFPETGIPTNIVTPIPKPITIAAQSRPMNRVLPMPTKTSKITTKDNIEIPTEKLKSDEKSLDTLIDHLIKPNFEPIAVKAQIAPIQVIPNFQPQNENERYKINDNSAKNAISTKTDPTKPLKARNILVTKVTINPNKPGEKSYNLTKEKVRIPNEKDITTKKKSIDIIAKNPALDINARWKKLKEESININEKFIQISEKTDIVKKKPIVNDKVTNSIKEDSIIKSNEKQVKLTGKNPATCNEIRANLNEKWTKLVEKSINSTTDKNTTSIKAITNLSTKGATSTEKSDAAVENVVEPITFNNEKVTKSKEKISNEKIITINTKPVIKNDKLQSSPENTLLYSVETLDGFQYSSTSISDLWTKVFESVQAARIRHDMLPLPSNSLNMMNGLQLLGLKSNGLKYLLEQLPSATKCAKYKPSFEFKKQEVDSDDEDIKLDISRGTRSVQYTRSHDPSDMFGWLASKHRRPIWNHCVRMEENTRRGGVITNLPMAMKFRNLKLTSKHSVGVYRSKIHRRGLFCHREIESGDMVIEYAGEVIRSILADQREKQYITKGMGCYMFRIDENFVVDATMKGNAARFINHSCEPNCYSKVIEVLGHKHIVIFALRKIGRGEELTYDYKFPFEEDKIPCTCGARRCRKFLN